LTSNVGAANDLAKAGAFKKTHINNGGVPTPDAINTAYAALSSIQKAGQRQQAISTANGNSTNIIST
jgi:hypothetical protein